MINIAKILLVFVAVLHLGENNPTNVRAKLVREYSGAATLCENEMAYLDEYAIKVDNEPDSIAYIIVYGGRLGTARHEMKQRRDRIKRYLIENRKIDPKRVDVIIGGFKELVTVELWLVSKGQKIPSPTATITPDKVKYKKTRTQFTCSSFY